ncbi:hypothetical protein H4R33_000840 [Dimargaris cristalligena]|nr:hypothetical protein H4R33_000840 [Dimargaris cristalligena]
MVETFRVFTVDTFTRGIHSFTGIPVAVCLLPADLRLPAATLRQLADEMGQSVTAFIQPLFKRNQTVVLDRQSEYTKSTHFRLQYFTPRLELKLCAHATLAAGHILFLECDNTTQTLTFETQVGPLKVARDEHPKGTRPVLLLPADVSVAVTNYVDGQALVADDATVSGDGGLISESRAERLRALVNQIFETMGSPPLIQSIVYGPLHHNVLVHIAGGPTELGHFAPTFGPAILSLGTQERVCSLIITTEPPPQAKTYDTAARCFSPWTGVHEEALTGSAYSLLAAYWSQRRGVSEIRVLLGSTRKGVADMMVSRRFGDFVQISGRTVTGIVGRFTM